MFGSQSDSREPLLTDQNGEPVALVIEGRVGNMPRHEDFLHGGVPHRDPLVEYYLSQWFQKIQRSWYPLCISEDGRYLDYKLFLEQLHNTRLKRNQKVYISTMPEHVLVAAEKVEDRTQRARGVGRWSLDQGRSDTDTWSFG